MEDDPEGVLMPFPCDDCCRCDNCSGNTPDQIDVTFDGIVNVSCGSCVNINDPVTFTVDWLRQIGDICYWRYTLPSAICYLDWIEVRAATGGVGVYWFQGSSQVASYFRTVGAPYDCMGWTNYDVPFGFNLPGSQCDLLSSTCKITALP